MQIQTFDGQSSTPISTTTVADDPVFTNANTLAQKAQQALQTNQTYLGIASPTNAQVAAQVQALTKECSALIRLLLGQLDSTAGT